MKLNINHSTQLNLRVTIITTKKIVNNEVYSMRFLTAGESHGPKLTTIVDGIPSNMKINIDQINEELTRRQGGYGRGRRMKIEKDKVNITAGVRFGLTLGSPICLELINDDHTHWLKIMSPYEIDDNEEVKRQIHKPRPGHADLVGGMKYNHRDLRNVLERSSARETAARVMVGAICKQLLAKLDIHLYSRVVQIGKIKDENKYTVEEYRDNQDLNDIRFLSDQYVEGVHQLIDETKKNGDSLGGIVEVVVDGLIPTIGSYTQFDKKMDAHIANRIMSINAFKGVEFGDGFEMANMFGSEVQDPINYNKENGFNRDSNHLGGLEGGMTNGMPLVIRAVMKPIPTLYKPLNSVDIHTKEPYKAQLERSDSCAVPAASIVCEHMVAIALTETILEEFQSNEINQLIDNYNRFKEWIKTY